MRLQVRADLIIRRTDMGWTINGRYNRLVVNPLAE